jgi:hypothetical protein
VINAVEARENLELTGGHDVDDDGPQEPCPTRHDVVKAVSTITKYLDNCNDPVAHKLEVLLGSFNRLLWLEDSKNMKETLLTDFFQKL